MNHFSEEDSRAILRQQQRQDEITAAVKKALAPAPTPPQAYNRFYSQKSLYPASDRRR